MKDLTHKMAQFFSGEDFAEHGEDARLELTPAELRQISNLMTENARLKTKLDKHNKAFDNIKDALNKWNLDTKISILSVWSILDRNLDEFAGDITEDIETLEQEPCEDCVSREEVIKINQKYHGYMPNEVNHKMWKEFNELQSTQPTRIPTEWVDIHDRLPEGNDTDRVLVCYYDGFITTHSVGRLRSTKDFVCEVAWMPLPKPYEPQESELDKENNK